MLLPAMFCTIFFILPLIGMGVGLLQRKRREQAKARVLSEETGMAAEQLHRAAVKTSQVFASRKIMEYQLIESQMRQPLSFKNHKGKKMCRAGP